MQRASARGYNPSELSSLGGHWRLAGRHAVFIRIAVFTSWWRLTTQFVKSSTFEQGTEPVDLDMSLYYFRISQGRYSGASDEPYEFASREAAWSEMTAVCGNLLGGISRSLKENAEWRMELLDEAKNPVFRIRLVAESIA